MNKVLSDEPNMRKLYVKLDNASSYHGNYAVEALHFLSKNKCIKLVRYNYNEPCRGKDQCGQEAACAKSLIQSYVDAGNDALTEEDIHRGLHYECGMKYSAVAVAHLNNNKKIASGTKILKISKYHSFEFHGSHMLMWRYFDIGKGVLWKYNCVKFDNNLQLVLSFRDTDSTNRNSTNIHKKSREDQELCDLYFYVKYGCNPSFSTVVELEQHMYSNNHTQIKPQSNMDKIKMFFIDRMNRTSNLHNTLQDNTACSNLKGGNGVTAPVNPLTKGCTLSDRSAFRFSLAQKKILYHYFMDGEKSVRKSSVEHVHLLIRK